MSDFETLQKYNIAELRLTLSNLGGAPNNKKKQELIEEILKIQSGEISAKRSNRGRPSERAKRAENGEYYVTGVKPHLAVLKDKGTEQPVSPENCAGYLEVVSDGYGFLYVEENFKESSIYVPLPLIKAHKLRSGDFVEGSGSLVKDRRMVELSQIDKVNGHAPMEGERPTFSAQEPLCPTRQLVLGSEVTPSLKAIDTACPIGYGQRVAVLSGSKRQTKEFIVNILDGLKAKGDEVKTILHLIEERPEQINFYKKAYGFADILHSSFDKDAKYRVSVAQMAFARATALCEEGNDVVLIVSSMSKLLKACLGVGGLYAGEAAATEKAVIDVLKCFGLARALDNGSLTVIGVLDEDWDFSLSKAFNRELLQLANCKIVLDELLFEEGIAPAIDLVGSYTEDYELLFNDQRTILALRTVKKALRSGVITNKDAVELIGRSNIGQIIKELSK